MTPNFSRKTVEVLAKRAAYICSNPDCRARTVGPNTDPNKSTLIGEAAHIFGARPGAKRFELGMNDSARAEITNAIWLCRNCHKLVDTDENRYSREVLFAWREQHERYVLSELGNATDRIKLEQQNSELSQLHQYPPIVRRIVVDKPDGWEWRLTAELMRHLNGPLFRRMQDLRDGLYIKRQAHIETDEVVSWARNLLAELSNMLTPLCGLINRLNESWGEPGEPGWCNVCSVNS